MSVFIFYCPSHINVRAVRLDQLERSTTLPHISLTKTKRDVVLQWITPPSAHYRARVASQVEEKTFKNHFRKIELKRLNHKLPQIRQTRHHRATD